MTPVVGGPCTERVLVPPRLAARVRAAYGDAGDAWIAALPDQLARVAAEWALVRVGAPYAAASVGFVAPVRRADGASLVLKVVPPPTTWLAHEARALAHWDGAGAVRLVAADPEGGAVLLERAVPGAPLADLAARDDRAATIAAAGVIECLRAAAGDATAAQLPGIDSWTGPLAMPIGARAGRGELAAACGDAHAMAVELLADAGPATVLHGDLHHHNVLRAARAPWLAVDPKGLRGPREAEAAALLRNPRRFVVEHADRRALVADRVAILAERLGDDAGRVARWGHVLAVVAARWAADDDAESDDEWRRWLACADALRHVVRSRAGG